MPDLRKTKRRLTRLVEAKRARAALETPCADCGERPGVQYVDESGTNVRTGRPACNNCTSIMQTTNPGGLAVIQGYGVDPDDAEPEDDNDNERQSA